MVPAAAERTLEPAVDDVEGQRCVNADRRMQRRGRLPGAVSHAGHVLARATRGLQGQRHAIDADPVARVVQTGDAHLDALQRRVHVTHRAAGRALLAHHMPRLQRVAQRQVNAAHRHLAHHREAELEMRREPLRIERERTIARLGEFRQRILEIHLHEGRQQKAVVQLGAPACQRAAVRPAPEARHQRAQQQLLRQTHPRVRRHLEGAKLQQAQPAGRAVGRIQLVDAELGAVRVAGHVDQDVAQRPVHQPRRARTLGGGAGLQLRQRDLQLVELVVARLVDPRCLRGRPDEEPREQVRQARMVVPERDQAAEQIRPAQERRIGRRGAAEHEVVAAAGATVAAVEHELLGRQPRLVGGVVQELGVIDQFVPVMRRMDVDLDDARVRRHLKHPQAWIARRRVAFEHDRHPQLRRGRFDRGQQLEIVVDLRQRRHEHVDDAALSAVLDLGARAVHPLRVAHFDAQRRARQP